MAKELVRKVVPRSAYFLLCLWENLSLLKNSKATPMYYKNATNCLNHGQGTGKESCSQKCLFLVVFVGKSVPSEEFLSNPDVL